MAILDGMNQLLQEALASVLPDGVLSQFLVNNAFWVLTLLLILFVLFVLVISFFLDFVTDAWKLPFAIGVDALKYFGLFNPWLAVAAAVAGALVFILLSDAGFVKWFFAALSVAVAVLVLLWGGLVIGVFLAVIPFNTVMMFLATILD